MIVLIKRKNVYIWELNFISCTYHKINATQYYEFLLWTKYKSIYRSKLVEYLSNLLKIYEILLHQVNSLTQSLLSIHNNLNKSFPWSVITKQVSMDKKIALPFHKFLFVKVKLLARLQILVKSKTTKSFLISQFTPNTFLNLIFLITIIIYIYNFFCSLLQHQSYPTIYYYLNPTYEVQINLP